MKKPEIDGRDILALLGVGVVAFSAWMMYPPAGGLVAGAYMLAVASRKG